MIYILTDILRSDTNILYCIYSYDNTDLDNLYPKNECKYYTYDEMCEIVQDTSKWNLNFGFYNNTFVCTEEVRTSSVSNDVLNSVSVRNDTSLDVFTILDFLKRNEVVLVVPSTTITSYKAKTTDYSDFEVTCNIAYANLKNIVTSSKNVDVTVAYVLTGQVDGVPAKRFTSFNIINPLGECVDYITCVSTLDILHKLNNLLGDTLNYRTVDDSNKVIFTINLSQYPIVSPVNATILTNPHVIAYEIYSKNIGTMRSKGLKRGYDYYKELGEQLNIYVNEEENIYKGKQLDGKVNIQYPEVRFNINTMVSLKSYNKIVSSLKSRDNFESIVYVLKELKSEEERNNLVNKLIPILRETENLSEPELYCIYEYIHSLVFGTTDITSVLKMLYKKICKIRTEIELHKMRLNAIRYLILFQPYALLNKLNSCAYENDGNYEFANRVVGNNIRIEVYRRKKDYDL